MSDLVLLVRHPPVSSRWAGRCYGRSDMGWSRAGAAMARRIAAECAEREIDTVVHSGAIRTRRLAAAIAQSTGAAMRCDPNWLERDFGLWEGRTWDAIWQETGDLMDRMMTDPAGFRPGGGETGSELSRRAAAAWTALPRTGTTLVIAHGGTIAAVRALLEGAPLERMIAFVPACGDCTTLTRHGHRVVDTGF